MSVTLAANASSGELAVGFGELLRIVVGSPTYVKFGPAGTAAATTSDIYLPANFPEVYDTGGNRSIAFLAVAGGVVNVSRISRS